MFRKLKAMLKRKIRNAVGYGELQSKAALTSHLPSFFNNSLRCYLAEEQKKHSTFKDF